MYEKFEKLLKANGCTAYQVSMGTKIAQSTLSDWKKGKSQPKKDKIEKICEYFNVPISYFYGEEEEKTKYYLNDETAAIAQDIFENKELRALFDAARDAEPGDLTAVHGMLLALKRKERGYSD